jgi:hypothetical protein
VYKLYDEYGFSKGDIGLLFIAGFGSSMLFGTVVGGFADKYGRKLNCLLFALLYGLSCVTKHFNDFTVLMVGRLLGGVATSILYSAFETWMIHEHRAVSRRGSAAAKLPVSGGADRYRAATTCALLSRRLLPAALDDSDVPFPLSSPPLSSHRGYLSLLSPRVQRSFHEDWLSSTFSQSTFGSGVVAIGAGILANFLAAHFGTVAPFDASLVLLVGGAAIILTRWRENYGEAHGAAGGGGNVSAFDSFRKAARLLVSNERVLLLGLIQSCFEGAMYIFVFMWTPALEASLKAAALYDSDATSLPHGVVFALFMVAIMIGSKIFETLIADRPVEHFMRWVFVAASAALAAPILTSNHYVQLAAFCTFEVCCGIYFPSAVRARNLLLWLRCVSHLLL